MKGSPQSNCFATGHVFLVGRFKSRSIWWTVGVQPTEVQITSDGDCTLRVSQLVYNLEGELKDFMDDPTEQ